MERKRFEKHWSRITIAIRALFCHTKCSNVDALMQSSSSGISLTSTSLQREWAIRTSDRSDRITMGAKPQPAHLAANIRNPLVVQTQQSHRPGARKAPAQDGRWQHDKGPGERTAATRESSASRLASIDLWRFFSRCGKHRARRSQVQAHTPTPTTNNDSNTRKALRMLCPYKKNTWHAAAFRLPSAPCSGIWRLSWCLTLRAPRSQRNARHCTLFGQSCCPCVRKNKHRSDFVTDQPRVTLRAALWYFTAFRVSSLAVSTYSWALLTLYSIWLTISPWKKQWHWHRTNTGRGRKARYSVTETKTALKITGCLFLKLLVELVCF